MKTHLWNWRACALIAALGITPGCGDDGGETPMPDAAPTVDGDPTPDADPNACVPMPVSRLAPDQGPAYTMCPVTECGSNSAEVNDLPIGEMHITPGRNTGMVNAWGAQLIDFIAPDGSRDYILNYNQGGRLTASRGPEDNPEILSGEDLIGSEFVIRNTANCQDIHVAIVRYKQEQSWTTSPYQVDLYGLGYIPPDMVNAPPRPICTDSDEIGEEYSWAVLVGGERYDWEKKEVSAEADQARGWFNFACYGNALYKMKFTGYDPFRSPDNMYESLPEDRQATLKMMTADYCGTGTSYTETGTPLYWVNKDGWSSNAAPPDSVIEAYWGPDGALCLGLPRLMDTSRQEVLDECATVSHNLPLCDEANPPANYIWESRIPAPM